MISGVVSQKASNSKRVIPSDSRESVVWARPASPGLPVPGPEFL